MDVPPDPVAPVGPVILTPEVPADPLSPDEPLEPDVPDDPFSPDVPLDPFDPDVPDDPFAPEVPLDPEFPLDPEDPLDPIPTALKLLAHLEEELDPLLKITVPCILPVLAVYEPTLIIK